MEQMDYMIMPVRMSGLIKEIDGDHIKVHLRGRLGVIVVGRSFIDTTIPLEPGVEVSFYFSYVEVVKEPLDYDDAGLLTPPDDPADVMPDLIGGTIIEVNDTAAKIAMMDDLGTVAVPRRWLFTPVALEVGEKTQFYMSRMTATGKSDIPVESI